MIEYKDKRKVVDDLKDSLQKMITEYSMITEQGTINYFSFEFSFNVSTSNQFKGLKLL